MLNFALLCQLFNAAIAVALLEFDPPVFSIQDSSSDATFKCRLTEKPAHDVTVYFEAPGLTFDKCSYVIPAASYDQYIEISARGVPVFDQRSGDDITITFKTDIQGYGYDDTTQTYHGHRKYSPCGTCHSIGDPHYQLLDGYSVTHQDQGVSRLFYHEHFEVQVTQAPCYKSATCNSAVAIRYGSSIFALDPRHNPKNTPLTYITPNTDGVVYIAPVTTGSGQVHKLMMPCGSIVELVHNDIKQGNYVDVTLHLSYGYEGYGGQCNQVIPAQPNHLYCSDGKYVSQKQVDTFFNSWKIQETDDFLSGHYKLSAPGRKGVYQNCKCPSHPIPPQPSPTPSPLPAYSKYVYSTVAVSTVTSMQPVPATSSPAVPTSAPVVGYTSMQVVGSTSLQAVPAPSTQAIPTLPLASATGYQHLPVQTTVSTQVTEAPSTSLMPIPITLSSTSAAPQYTYEVPPPNPQYQDQCTDYCIKLFSVPGCNTLLNPQSYIDACTSDSVNTGNYLVAEAMKLTYMSRCNTATSYLSHDAQPAMVQHAASVRQSCGLGNYTCMNNCSGNGGCSNNGCVCNPTFGGLDCSVSLPSLISYNPSTKSYGDNNPIYAAQPVVAVQDLNVTKQTGYGDNDQSLPVLASGAKGLASAGLLLAGLVYWL